MLRTLRSIEAQETPWCETIKCDPDENNVTGVLSAVYSRPLGTEVEVPVEDQDLDSEAITKSIFVHPDYAGLPEKLITEVRRQYQSPQGSDAIEDEQLSGYDISLREIGNVPGVTDAQRTLAKSLFSLMTLTGDSWEDYTFVFSRNRVVSRRYSTKVDLLTLNKIFTRAQLVAITGNPTLFDIPDMTLSTAESAAGFKVGWRKRLCRIGKLANGNKQITEQWILAKWSPIYRNV